jgi:hypothetical protein
MEGNGAFVELIAVPKSYCRQRARLTWVELVQTPGAARAHEVTADTLAGLLLPGREVFSDSAASPKKRRHNEADDREPGLINPLALEQ